MQPALSLAPTTYLDDIRSQLSADEIPSAVAEHDTPWLFGWLIGVSQFQGISDANAAAFAAKHGVVGWDDVMTALKAGPTCPRLRSYWSFDGCRYRKAACTCAEPQHLGACPLTTHPTRKGALIVAAYALALFVRDICDNDLVAWFDRRLAEADGGPDAPDRAVAMSRALVAPLSEISGIGKKVWSMALADLLLAADPDRERWVTSGAAMIVVDSLLHNHLHRTGTLRRFRAEHPYGPRCYAPGGCADLIRGLANRVDARAFNPTFPACFPRFVQFAMWRLCSASELDLCNGNRIDDRQRCANAACPIFPRCDRVVLCPSGTGSGILRLPAWPE
ncbi:hypothetical protein [Methylobacterium aquaticum]|nr:hypothetical protein [Methylobacterium aquaticum]